MFEGWRGWVRMVLLVRGGTYVCCWYVYECPYYTQCPSLLLSLVASLLCMGCNIVLLLSHLILSSLLSLLQATLPLLGLFIDSVEAVSHQDMPCLLQHAVIRSTYIHNWATPSREQLQPTVYLPITSPPLPSPPHSSVLSSLSPSLPLPSPPLSSPLPS